MTKEERKTFILKIIGWSLFAWVCPVIFIGWRYDLFKKASSLQLSGWGLIAIVITFAFLMAIVKYIRAGFQEWSMVKQVINGAVKIILPLGVLLALCVGIRNSLDVFIQALGCVIVCEAVAIPMNPFPEWVYKKSKGRFESAVDYLADKLNNKNKGE